jgi:hypothetical protein
MKPEKQSAFPHHNDAGKQYNWTEQGMDLRDYFAAKAMQGLLASLGEWTSGLPSHEFSESLAADAFWIANAMMKEREKS